MSDSTIPKLVPLSFAIGSMVSEGQVKAAFAEAASFPEGTREYKAFIEYARYLQRKLIEQRKIDGEGNPFNS